MSKRQVHPQRFNEDFADTRTSWIFLQPDITKPLTFPFFHIAAVCRTQIQSDRLTPDFGWSSHSIEASGFTCSWAVSHAICVSTH